METAGNTVSEIVPSGLSVSGCQDLNLRPLDPQ
jgi:hypothetical protein